MVRNQKRNEQGPVSNLKVPTEVLELNLCLDFLTASKSEKANMVG